MYRIDDTKAYIRQIQRYLMQINSATNRIAETGIYDDRTKRSVEEFQQKNSLAVTGVVDLDTFSLMRSLYFTEKEKDRVASITLIKFPLSPGDYSEEMLTINALLAELLGYYGIATNLRPSRYYSSATSDAVITLRKIYLLPSIDNIDEVLYGRLFRDKTSIDSFLKTADGDYS